MVEIGSEAGMAELEAVDTGNIVDNPAGMDRSQDTVGNIAGTVGNTADQVWIQQLQTWLGVEDSKLLADSRSGQKVQ